VDGSGLLILSLVNGFQDGLRAVLLSGWQRITHTSARQWLSRQFAHPIAQRITQRIAQSSDRQRLSRQFALRLTQRITGRMTQSSARRRLTRRFARRIAQRMAVDYSFFRSSMAFTTVIAPYCSADHSADRVIFRSSYCTSNGTTARSWVHSFLMLFDDSANILRAVDSCTVLLGGWLGGSLITPAR